MTRDSPPGMAGDDHVGDAGRRLAEQRPAPSPAFHALSQGSRTSATWSVVLSATPDNPADNRIITDLHPDNWYRSAKEANVIRLDETSIEHALPLVSVGLEKYCRLQADLATTDVSHDRSFQTRFNGFYRVRRNAAWQSCFYNLLQQEKSVLRPFADVLKSLYKATEKIEASFASKLVASVDPDNPVIDSIVLKNLGLRLTRYGAIDARMAGIVELHDHIRQKFADFLDSQMGHYLTARFAEFYPERQVTRIKMLDLVLWQTRQVAEPMDAREAAIAFGMMVGSVGPPA